MEEDDDDDDNELKNCCIWLVIYLNRREMFAGILYVTFKKTFLSKIWVLCNLHRTDINNLLTKI
jgi:hypothetical protein